MSKQTSETYLELSVLKTYYLRHRAELTCALGVICALLLVHITSTPGKENARAYTVSHMSSAELLCTVWLRDSKNA